MKYKNNWKGMIHSYLEYKEYLKHDSIANIRKESYSVIDMMLNIIYGSEAYRALRYLKRLRQFEYVLNCRKGVLGKISCIVAKVRLHRLGAKYNIFIKPNVVGYGLRIPHLVGGVIINCKSIGKYCIVNSGVIVGDNNRGELAIIGDNVDLTVGCKVIGGVKIGNNVTVAPNSVVVKDIPANAVVSGVPAVILKMKIHDQNFN